MIACPRNLVFPSDVRICRTLPGCSVPCDVFGLFPQWSRRRHRIVSRLGCWCSKKGKPKKIFWWQKFFSDGDDESWLNWSAEDVLGVDGLGQEERNEDVPEDEKFEAWKSRAEAIVELRVAQEEDGNEENRAWNDWLREDGLTDSNSLSWDQNWGGRGVEPPIDVNDDPEVVMRENGIVEAIKNTFAENDDELLFEDRVFRYASGSSAKFVAFLILVPWLVDFVVHDYVLMPFLDRYVKTVPLAAHLLDVRKQQKLDLIKTLKLERARIRLEVEIGAFMKKRTLRMEVYFSNDEVIWTASVLKEHGYLNPRNLIARSGWNILHRIELRDEWRLENRRAFANIWSDLVYGIMLFVLLYLNKRKVALLKFTGYKLLNKVSDTGKAFLIILITDIFLGYHSESGWQALIDIILEHYGLEVDEAAVTIFICFVPVVIDACVKLWLFKFLPRLSPNVLNIFRDMQRH